MVVCRLLVPGLMTLTLATAATAQLPPQFAMPGMPKEYQELMTAMAAAQAKAIRPGDEAMTCPAIEKELLTAVNDPAIQAYAEKAGALVQKQALGAAKAQGTAAPQAAAALATALGAGLPAGGGLVGQPPLAAQQALGAQMARDQLTQMKLMLPILPQMMRSQQLIALAMGKRCAWMTGINQFAPLAIPVGKEGLQ